MSIWVTIGVVLSCYIVLVFGIVPSVIPFMRRTTLPSRIPKQLSDAIVQLESTATSKYEYLRMCADYLLSQNTGARLYTITHASRAFQTDMKDLLKREGHLHAQHFNVLLRIMLVKSRFFTDQDVRIARTFLNFFVHQYLKVKIAGQWYPVDLWANFLGVQLGNHASGFR